MTAGFGAALMNVFAMAPALATCLFVAPANAQSPPGRTEAFDIPAPHIASRASTDIIVHLPPAYDGDARRRFPVALFLHGWGSDSGAFGRVEGDAALARLPETDQFIVVSVSGETSGYRNWADGENLWEDHLFESVVPFVESQYAGRAETARIGFYGVSMGGAAALRLAMTRPERGACAAAHSAALSPVDFDDLPDWRREGFLQMADFGARYGEPFEPALWRAESPLHLARMLGTDQLKRSQYYFDVGIDDHLGFADDNAALSQALAARDIPHLFGLREGGHGGDFVVANMDAALRFLAGCLGETP